jgi:hypothetical protein
MNSPFMNFTFFFEFITVIIIVAMSRDAIKKRTNFPQLMVRTADDLASRAAKLISRNREGLRVILAKFVRNTNHNTMRFFSSTKCANERENFLYFFNCSFSKIRRNPKVV